MSLKDYNSYLFAEFGFIEEHEESKVSDTWPHTFNHIADFDILGTETKVYEFKEENEDYYLVDGSSLTFYDKENLEPDALKMMLLGSSWIGEKDPVDLNTMDTRDPRIPRIPERKEYLTKLWRNFFGNSEPKILEGLYLKKTGKYLALGEDQEEKRVNVFGDGIIVRNIPFKEISTSKRLSIGIGKLIADSKI